MPPTGPARPIALLLTATMLLVFPYSARAQNAETVLVVPVSAADRHRDKALALARDVMAILQRKGISGVPLDSTAALFSERHSRDPAPVSEQDYDRLQREAELLSRSMQEEKPTEAARHLKEVQRLAESVGESVNRDLRTRESIFRSCVIGVRMALRARKPDDAEKCAVWCLTMAQGEDITAGRQPADVRDVLLKVQRSMELGATAPLTVSSSENGTVILNASRLGPAPYTLEHPAARPYRVQIAKDGIPGRVHMVTPGPHPTSVLVNLEFDRSVVTTEPTLRFHYPTFDPQTMRSHGQMAAQALKATSAILVGATSDNQLFMRRVTRRGGRAATLQAPYNNASLDVAVQELFAQPDQAEHTSSAPDTEGSGPTHGQAGEPTHRQAPSQARWPLQWGLPLVAAGAATMAAGYWRLRARAVDGEAFRHTAIGDLRFRARGDGWLAARPEAFVLVAPGMALASAGVSIAALRLPVHRYRWLTVSSAAVGLGLATAGLVAFGAGGLCEAATAPGGNLQRCVRAETGMDRGAIMALSAIPLLTLPAVQLVRWLKIPTRPTLHAAADQVSLRLDGKF